MRVSPNKLVVTMPTIPTRRAFLQSAALLPPVALSSLSFGQASAPLAPIRRSGGAHLRISLNAYSFSDLLNARMKDPSKGLDLFELCDFCAKHGFDAVDVTGYFFPGYPKAPDRSYIIKLKRHAFDLGLEISGTGVRNDFTAADKAVRDEGVQRIKTWIEVAATLGAPTIRAFADSQAPFKNWQEASKNASRSAVETWMADSLRECAEYGQKFGVIVAVQNHGDFIDTGEKHRSLLERVGHDWCRAMVDTGMYRTPDPYVDIALMAPHAVNWQVKETLGNTIESPRIDAKRLITIVRKSGYRGYLPIETLVMRRPDYDPFVEVPRLLAELRRAIQETAPAAP
jgi:sugar phosphate isomerase/epimerase